MRRGIAIVLALAALAAPSHAAAQAGVSYTVPADNPFAGQAGARPEIWAYGLRNPWRFSFDRATGDLAIGDVGQDAVEEIDFAPAGTGAGANYGWNCFEGSQPFAGCSAPGHVRPAFEYTSTQAACSVIGGYVVRDPALAIAGRYVYGDFCTGELRTIRFAAGGATDDRSLNLTVPALSAFGQDAASRIFVVEKGGTIKVATGAGAPTTFLDISADVSSTDQERGLLSMAFAPDYATSGRLYTDYTDSNGDIRIEEVRRSATDPNVADPSTAPARAHPGASSVREPQRRPASVRARRPALRDAGRRRRGRRSARERAEPGHAARQDPPHRPAPAVAITGGRPREVGRSHVAAGLRALLLRVRRQLAGARPDPDYDSVHVNAEFADQASDHDPQVARLRR